MGSGIFFPLCAIPFSVLIIILFYSKGHIKSKETKIFKVLVISNLFGLIIELLCTYASMIYNKLPYISIIIYKTYLLYIIVWISTFAYYIFNISIKNEKKLNKEGKIIIFIYTLSIILTLIILPIEVIIKDNFQTRYTTGLSVYFSYFISGIAIIIIVLSMLLNIKKMEIKKYIPVFIFLIMGGTAIFIQSTHPEILMMTYVETLICVIMYFTMENPDLKIINELEINRRIVDQNNEAKSNLLFKLSQELRHPLKEIIDLGNKMKNSNIETVNEFAVIVNQKADKMYNFVTNVLDMTSLDFTKVKVYEAKYNIRNLMDQVVMLCREKLKDGIDFQYDISPSVPEVLYGDKIIVKQIIYSLILNVLEYTNSGFVSLSLESINRYDISRLVFVIEDSGSTLSIDEVNKILSCEEPLTAQEIKGLENSKIDLILINRLIKSYDGNLIIKSLANKGNSYTITIDQKSDDNNFVVDYNNKEFKRVLLVSNNEYLLEKSYKLFKRHFVVVSKSMYELDVLDRIRNGEVIDYVIIDSELKDTNVIKFQKQIRKLCNDEIKIIIIIPFFQEKIKEKYKKAGFDDYILFSDINKEIGRIIKGIQ